MFVAVTYLKLTNVFGSVAATCGADMACMAVPHFPQVQLPACFVGGQPARDSDQRGERTFTELDGMALMRRPAHMSGTVIDGDMATTQFALMLHANAAWQVFRLWGTAGITPSCY